MTEFKMPSLGADMEAGTLVEWLVKPGDWVKRGDIIAVVDTQKGLIDIEVFDEGEIKELVVKENEKVPVGRVLALIASKEKPLIAPVKQIISPETVAAETLTLPLMIKNEIKRNIKASPLAKVLAQEKGVDLNKVKGTGEDGVITRRDVERIMMQKLSPAGDKGISSETGFRMAIAAAMSKSNREIPHYYLSTKVDMSKSLIWLTEANKQRNIKKRLLPAVLLVKAVAKSLKDVPQLNGYWENGLQLIESINIGFVVSLRDGGIIIPAIQQADKLTVDAMMAMLNDIIPRARSMKLRSSELSASTITVTHLGEGNVESVFGVIYPPQVAIVGFGSIHEEPWAENGMLAVRPVLNVSLSGDHRATDGITGSRFLTAVKNYLLRPDSL